MPLYECLTTFLKVSYHDMSGEWVVTVWIDFMKTQAQATWSGELVAVYNANEWYIAHCLTIEIYYVSSVYWARVSSSFVGGSLLRLTPKRWKTKKGFVRLW